MDTAWNQTIGFAYVLGRVGGDLWHNQVRLLRMLHIFITFHSVSFSGSSLTIGENGRMEPVYYLLHVKF